MIIYWYIKLIFLIFDVCLVIAAVNALRHLNVNRFLDKLSSCNDWKDIRILDKHNIPLSAIKLFDMSVPRRIKLYKYLDNDNVDISADFPELKDVDWENAKHLWAIVKSLPKGSAHHEHNFSIIYTMNFLIYLLNNPFIFIKDPKMSVVSK